MGNFISGQMRTVQDNTPYAKYAYTGDSLLMCLEIAMENNQATIKSVNPILISNYKNPNLGVVVDLLEDLAAEHLYDLWSDYYKIRLSIMTQFLNEMPLYISE